MSKDPAAQVSQLMERAGLQLTESDARRLASLYEKYLERLQALHAADLDSEEVASVFPAQWSQGR